MMKPKQYTVVGWLGAAALGLALTACGSGPGSVEGSAVTGVVLANGPIQGTVSLNDSSVQVKSRTVSTRSDGTFSIDVADLTPPYLLKVEWQGAAAGEQLFAVSEGNDNLDVNPISDVAFAAASGDRDSDDVFKAPESEDNRRTATRARALLVRLGSVLAPLFERYGITDPLADKAAVRALLADVTVTRHDGVVTVTNKATLGVIFQGPLADLASGTFHPENMPAGPGTTPPPTPGTCTGFTYSAWGACQNNTQSRTVTSSTPASCTGGSPVTSQACTTPPPTPATCTSFTYSAWGTCQSNNTQTRTVASSGPTGCTGGSPVTSQACTYVPPPTIDGAALYTQYCSGCHGNGKKGSSASAIQNAINSNRGGMGSLSSLTPAQVAAISAAP